MLYFISLCVLVLAFGGYVDSQELPTWSYSGANGPEYWSTTPDGALCDGRLQSPIDITDDSTVFTNTFGPWVPTGGIVIPGGPTFSGPFATDITNTGNLAIINLSEGFTLSGGGLPGTFKAIEFRLHWGADNTRGSEHTIDGRQSPGEAHLVLYDSKYSDFETALSYPQGVAISAWLIEEGRHNIWWDPILNYTSEYEEAGSSYEFQELVGFQEFDTFYRYNGSLTSPGCQESVIWSIFRQPVVFSTRQLDALRSLKMYNGEPLVDNFRPVQALNDRTVYSVYIPSEEEYSCYGRCNAWDDRYPCQCNADCRKYGDCCDDYADNCLVEVCSMVHTYGKKMRKVQGRY